MDLQRPSILFVDDEPSILKALRRLLLDEDWTLFFATSGAEGLAILAREPVDLVVSDFRMPEMDGVTFLRTVKELYPAITRIFLSGYADIQSVTKALSEGCARQILPKPWDEGILRQVLREALQQAQDQRERNDVLRNLINSIPALPTLPKTYLELRECFQDPEGLSAERVADIVRQDTALSTTLLHWGNSALFGQMSRVDTVKRAIVVLGMDIIEGLFLSSVLTDTLGPGALRIPGFNYAAFQRHATSSAALARLLVRSLPQVPGDLPDRAFTAALVHDMGKLVEANYLADSFATALARTQERESLLLDAEAEVLKVTHQDLGGYLAEWWSLPGYIIQTIRWHHAPLESLEHHTIVETVHLANVLAQQFQLGHSGNGCLPLAAPEVWDKYQLDEAALDRLQSEVKNLL